MCLKIGWDRGKCVAAQNGLPHYTSSVLSRTLKSCGECSMIRLCWDIKHQLPCLWRKWSDGKCSDINIIKYFTTFRTANIQTCHCRAGPLSSAIIMLTHECESLPGALEMACANPGGVRGAWSLGLWHCCAALSLGCLVCGASNDWRKTIATGQRPRMMADGAWHWCSV